MQDRGRYGISTKKGIDSSCGGYVIEGRTIFHKPACQRERNIASDLSQRKHDRTQCVKEKDNEIAF